jgi:hypothetical protein
MKRAFLAAACAVVFIAGALFAQQTIGPADSVPVGPGGRTLSGSGDTTTQPAKSSTSKPGKPQKYDVPTDLQVQQGKAMMEAVFQRALQEVNPNLHKVETAHFIVFSGIGPAPSKPGAPPTGVDKAIGETMERMYKVLCTQFDIAQDETVWVGKCGLFLLTMPDKHDRNIPDKQFYNFVTKVDHLPEAIAKGAAGYFRSSALQSYIVMKPSPDDKWDLDYWKVALIHESTHAFLWRYVSNRPVPLWLNEGIAETSAATIMDSRALTFRLREANRAAFKGRDVTPVFKTVGLGDFDYGIAQSWVRFLLLKDHKAFIKFVTLCKQGTNDEEAMRESFKFGHEDFLRAWAGWAKTVR